MAPQSSSLTRPGTRDGCRNQPVPNEDGVETHTSPGKCELGAATCVLTSALRAQGFRRSEAGEDRVVTVTHSNLTETRNPQMGDAHVPQVQEQSKNSAQTVIKLPETSDEKKIMACRLKRNTGEDGKLFSETTCGGDSTASSLE